MVDELDERVQRERAFAIVDEVDNILIDEARTPLIISGQAEESADLYFTFARLVPQLQERPEGAEEGGDYFLDLKDKAVSPTEEGIDKIESSSASRTSTTPTRASPATSSWRSRRTRSTSGDRDYIVKDGEIVIVDEFTGRQMPGRRWSEGLHQAIEAKEGLRVQRESGTLATITFQNYFRLYDKLAGMTGTAMTEAEEFHKIYNLEVVAIPTHRPMIREDFPDLVYPTRRRSSTRSSTRSRRWSAQGGRSWSARCRVEKSEVLSTLLKRRGIKHEMLNAKFHERSRGSSPRRAAPARDDRHEHGRPRHGHPARRQPAGLASEILHKRDLNPAEVDKATYDAALAEAKAITVGRPRAGRRGGRAAHHRHRAPRQPADRQPAARPRPAARATRARRASTSRSTTTS